MIENMGTEIRHHPHRSGKTQAIAASNIGKVTVEIHQTFDTDKYISETEEIIKKKLGDDFIVLHNGGMSWRVQPRLRETNIAGTVTLTVSEAKFVPDQDRKQFWHEQKKRCHRTEQKLKEWGYRVNEKETQKSCGGCQFSIICEHIEGFYPEVHCERLDILHLDGMQIEWLGVCNRYKKG